MTPHSRLGLISLWLAILILAANFVLVVAWVTSSSDVAWKHEQMFFNFLFPFVFTPLLHFAGLIAGIWGAIADRKKAKTLVCFLGILLNSVVAAVFWIFVMFIITPVGVH